MSIQKLAAIRLCLQLSAPLGLAGLWVAGVSLPIQAATLNNWTFNTASNQLEVTVSPGITPRYFVLEQPLRIVIDLPDTEVGNAIQQQSYSGAVRQIRVSQFQPGLTRIVMELAPEVKLASEPVSLQLQSASNGSAKWVLRPILATNAANSDLTTALPPPTFWRGNTPSVSVPPLNSASNSGARVSVPPLNSASNASATVSVPPLNRNQPTNLQNNVGGGAAALMTQPANITNQQARINLVPVPPVRELPPPDSKPPVNSRVQNPLPAIPTPAETPINVPPPLPNRQTPKPTEEIIELPANPETLPTIAVTPVAVQPAPVPVSANSEAVQSPPALPPTVVPVINFGEPLPKGEQVSLTPAVNRVAALASGVVLKLRYPGTTALSLPSGTPQQEVMLLHEAIRDETGNFVLSAGVPVIGRFETSQEGSRFVTQAVTIGDRNFPFIAQSNLIAPTLQPGQILELQLTQPFAQP